MVAMVLCKARLKIIRADFCFNDRIKSADKKYMESFQEELDLFKGRIRKKKNDRRPHDVHI